jgi:hypothetical protein
MVIDPICLYPIWPMWLVRMHVRLNWLLRLPFAYPSLHLTEENRSESNEMELGVQIGKEDNREVA